MIFSTKMSIHRNVHIPTCLYTEMSIYRDVSYWNVNSTKTNIRVNKTCTRRNSFQITHAQVKSKLSSDKTRSIKIRSKQSQVQILLGLDKLVSDGILIGCTNIWLNYSAVEEGRSKIYCPPQEQSRITALVFLQFIMIAWS